MKLGVSQKRYWSKLLHRLGRRAALRLERRITESAFSLGGGRGDGVLFLRQEAAGGGRRWQAVAGRRRAGRWRRLGGAEAAARCGGPVPSVVDVPVTMQVEFQQSSLYVWMVPRIQFIDRVLHPPVCDGGLYPQCKLCRRPTRSHRCCSWCCGRARCCTTTGAGS